MTLSKRLLLVPLGVVHAHQLSIRTQALIRASFGVPLFNILVARRLSPIIQVTRMRDGLIALLMWAGMVLACGQSSTTESANDWYSGGTLHDQTIATWRSAGYENRLATSADFVMGLGEYDVIPGDLRERAEEMESCISEASAEGQTDNQSVATVGAMCGVMLGY